MLQGEDSTWHKPSLVVKGRAQGSPKAFGFEVLSAWNAISWDLYMALPLLPLGSQLKSTLLRVFPGPTGTIFSIPLFLFLHSTCRYLVLFCWLICLLAIWELHGNPLRTGTFSACVRSQVCPQDLEQEWWNLSHNSAMPVSFCDVDKMLLLLIRHQ